MKNLSLSREHEMRDIGCTVDSCLSFQYTVRFLRPDGVPLQDSITSSATMMTFNWQATIKSDLAGGNYTCEVLWDMGGMRDSAVFRFAGECVQPTYRNDGWLVLACSECV